MDFAALNFMNFECRPLNNKAISVLIVTLGLSITRSADAQSDIKSQTRLLDIPKKTLCSITINSDNEINTFKKNLDANQWNFVELATNRNQGHADFEKMNCRPDLKCDILLISGHFSGSFIGHRADSLSLKSMEAMSCRPACDGVFKAPSQVYLFGCNTLSKVDSIDPDPDQFFAHLIATGYSIPAAASVIGYRTSARQQDMKSRMRDLFSKSKWIMGFEQAAPSGPQIEKSLDRYLKMNRPFEELPRTTNLFSVTRGTEYSNSSPTGPNGYCSLYQSRAAPEFWSTALELFQNNKGLANIDHMETVATKNGLIPFSNSFGQVGVVSKTLTDTMALRGDPYIYFKAKILKSYFNLGWISFSDFENYKNLIVNAAAPSRSLKTQLLCETGFRSFSTSFDEIPKSRFFENHFLQALSCIPPVDARLLEHLLDLVLKGELMGRDAEYALSAISRSPTRNPIILQKIGHLFKMQNDEAMTNFLRAIFRSGLSK